MDKTSILITVLGAVFASTGFWTLINNIYQQKIRKRSAEQRALIGLLHERIFERCEEVIDRGYISREEYENLEYLYKPYIEMGGNGTAKRLFEEVNRMPIKEVEQ